MFIEIQQTTGDIKIFKKYINKIKDPNCYLEIGTHEGGTALLAYMITDKVYSIDISQKRDADFNDNIEINFINKASQEAIKNWDKPIGVLFIDGNHFEAYQDFLAWEKYVVKGGYILIHDYVVCAGNSVIKDCQPLLKDERYEKLFIPKEEGDETSILVLQKIE